MSDNDFMGPIKTTPELFLKLIKRVQKSDYTINILQDRKGRKAMFYNWKGENFNEHDCVILKATIAEHRMSTFDGKPLTYLNRVTVLENKGSTETPAVTDDHQVELENIARLVANEKKEWKTR